jgi:hypothetical protein
MIWYEDNKNLIELAEFLVEAEEIKTVKDLLDYFKYPEKYNEVWETYQEEVLGKSSPTEVCTVPALVSLIHPSAQCIH